MAAQRAGNDPKMAPQNDPKSTKNRCQKMIEILIEDKAVPPIHLGRPGGMRWPPGGIIGGSKNLLFELCRYLEHIMALRFGDLAFASAFGCRSSTHCSASPRRAADLIWTRSARTPPPPCSKRRRARVSVRGMRRLRCSSKLRLSIG